MSSIVENVPRSMGKSEIKEEIMKHKKKSEIKLGKSEIFTEDLYSLPSAGKCPECGGILVTNYGDGISCTFCVDCDYNEYDYD